MSNWILKCIVSVSVVALAAGQAAAEGTVSLLTMGGAVKDGGEAVLWGPAAKKLGITLREDTTDEGLPAVRLQVGANNVTSDIVIMSSYEAELGGREGILEPIDYSKIDASKFIPGTTAPYCVGIYGYTTVLAWNTKTYPKDAPSSWKDFFDVKTFPGKRAIRGSAETQIEIALLADGVKPDELYKVMSTDAGIQRAIDKIRSIKPNISVWWSSGAQHAQLMQDGDVDMSTGWNGRFQNAKDAGGKVDYTFNQGILATDCFAVPKGAPHKDLAMNLIAAMSTAEAQANMTKYITYGPVIPAAFDLGIIPEKTAKLLPTNPTYLKTLIVQDVKWWADHNDKVQAIYENLMTE